MGKRQWKCDICLETWSCALSKMAETSYCTYCLTMAICSDCFRTCRVDDCPSCFQVSLCGNCEESLSQAPGGLAKFCKAQHPAPKVDGQGQPRKRPPIYVDIYVDTHKAKIGEDVKHSATTTRANTKRKCIEIADDAKRNKKPTMVDQDDVIILSSSSDKTNLKKKGFVSKGAGAPCGKVRKRASFVSNNKKK